METLTGFEISIVSFQLFLYLFSLFFYPYVYPSIIDEFQNKLLNYGTVKACTFQLNRNFSLMLNNSLNADCVQVLFNTKMMRMVYVPI